MAKKAAKGQKDIALLEKAVENFFAAAIPKDTDPGGIHIPWYSLQYLFDSDYIRYGHVIQLAGEPASGKSLTANYIIALAVRAGGFGIHIDTEHKTSKEASIIPLVGKDVYESGRFEMCQASAVDAVAETVSDDEKSWMNIVSSKIQTIKENEILRAMPGVIVVDSMFGVASQESKKKFDELGHGSGRSTAGAARAGTVQDYMANITEMLAGTNTVLILVNHGKKKISMDGRPVYGDPRSLPGGSALLHHTSLVLWFERGASVKKAGRSGRVVRIDNRFKNSFGCDDRKIEVTFYADIPEGAEADEFGNFNRRITWEWHLASTQLLFRFISGKTPEGGVKALFPGLSVTKSLVGSKSLGIEDVPMTDFGRMLAEDPAFMELLNKYIKTAVHRGNREKQVFASPDPRDILSTDEDGDWVEVSEEEGDGNV